MVADSVASHKFCFLLSSLICGKRRCRRPLRLQIFFQPLHSPKKRIVFALLLLAALRISALGVIYLTLDQALALAFEDSKAAQQHSLIFNPSHRKAIEKKLGEPVSQRGVLIYTGTLKSGGSGVAMFDTVIGKHEFIDYMVVLDHDGDVKFIEILAYRESYGGEVRSKNWRDQFVGKSLQEPPEHKKNIVNISGATLSCRHITQGVRKLLVVAEVYANELGLKNEKFLAP